MAIEVAPPVVAGNAWFALDGGRADAVAFILAGYAFLMVVVQLRLVPLYRTAPFGPAFWSFSFAYAAVAAFALHWLTAQDPAGAGGWAVAVLVLLTAGYVALVARTVLGLARRSFLPRAAR
jgi:tellurite resistance protein